MKKGPPGWLGKKNGMKKILPVYIGIIINSTMIRTPVIKHPGFPMESRAPRFFFRGPLMTSDLLKGQPKEGRKFLGDRKMLRKQNAPCFGRFPPKKTCIQKDTRSLSVPFIGKLSSNLRGWCSPLQFVGTR